jgi:SAM-dependent methyltransferase
VLEQLPATVRYVGIDISSAYIELARQRFGEQATFLVGTAGTFLERGTNVLNGADLVVCNGLLHHLGDDEVLEVLQLAATILRPHGRFVALEPTYLQHQPPVSRWIMDQDRGRNIRTDTEWSELARRAFPDASARILTGLLRLPYTHVVLEGTNRGTASIRPERVVADDLLARKSTR